MKENQIKVNEKGISEKFENNKNIDCAYYFYSMNLVNVVF